MERKIKAESTWPKRHPRDLQTQSAFEMGLTLHHCARDILHTTTEIFFGTTYFSAHLVLSAQSSLSIFAQKYLRKCEDTTYFVLQNKYLPIYEDSFGAKIPKKMIVPS